MTNITLRNVDALVFRKFKVKAVEDGTSLGKAVTQALLEWLGRHGIRRKKSLLGFKPVSFGKGSERTSEQIDEILYGAK